MADKREIDLSLVDIVVDVGDFAVDQDGNVRIASRKIAKKVKAAIEQAQTRYPADAKVKGKMVIPVME